MDSLTLAEALQAVSRLKAGEALPTVNIGGVEYFPRKVVKFTSGLSDAIENTDLVLPKYDKEVGVRNIDKDQLDYPFLPTGLRMRFDTTTGVGVTAKTANYKDDAPVYWKNGEIRIQQDSELLNLPVSVVGNSYAATSNADDFYPVAPFLIRPNKSFKISTSLAGVAVANHAFRLEIEGIEFVKNNR